MLRTTWMSLTAAVTMAACAADVGVDKGHEPEALGVEAATLGRADHANNAYRGELAYGTTESDALSARLPVHYWSFEGSAGDALFLDLASRGGDDTYLQLFVQDDGGWAFVDANDDCRGSLNSCLELELSESALYLVAVTSYRYAATRRPTVLRYDVTLHCVNESGVCGAPVEQACGSRGLRECPEGSYCDWDDRDACGYADGPGVCRPRPEIQLCTRIADPIEVCGCDGETYPTECFAAANGVDVASLGACAGGGQGAGETCGGIANLACETGLVCDYSSVVGCDIADVAGVCAYETEILCTAEYDPVCGCDGTTYSNDCARRRARVALAHTGECH